MSAGIAPNAATAFGYGDRPPAQVINFKKVVSGALRGFCDVRWNTARLTFRNCAVYVAADGRAWCGLPSAPVIDSAGRHYVVDGEKQISPGGRMARPRPQRPVLRARDRALAEETPRRARRRDGAMTASRPSPQRRTGPRQGPLGCKAWRSAPAKRGIIITVSRVVATAAEIAAVTGKSEIATRCRLLGRAGAISPRMRRSGKIAAQISPSENLRPPPGLLGGSRRRPGASDRSGDQGVVFQVFGRTSRPQGADERSSGLPVPKHKTGYPRRHFIALSDGAVCSGGSAAATRT